jgi:hypothetical protein
LIDRVFILGTLSEPEALKPDLNSGFKKEEIFQRLGIPDRGLSTTASRPAGHAAGCGFGSGIS